MKIKALFRTHQYKIIIGAPIIFLLLINTTGMIGTGNIFLFTAEKNAFPIAGENVRINLQISTRVPVNAVGGTIIFPTELLAVDSIARDTSIIDLWAEEPSFSNTDGTLHLSGGIVPHAGQTGDHGTVLTVSFRALKPGKATISIKDGQLLAANGEGTNVISGNNAFTLYIGNQGRPSPDVNGDGVLSISDIDGLYLNTFRAYDTRYDLNGDGKVSWADVRFLISLI